MNDYSMSTIPIDDYHHHIQKYAEALKGFNYDEFFKSAFEPKIVDDSEHGGKKIDLTLDMTGFRPDQIQIHLKDHDLIVQVGKTNHFPITC